MFNFIVFCGVMIYCDIPLSYIPFITLPNNFETELKKAITFAKALLVTQTIKRNSSVMFSKHVI